MRIRIATGSMMTNLTLPQHSCREWVGGACCNPSAISSLPACSTACHGSFVRSPPCGPCSKAPRQNPPRMMSSCGCSRQRLVLCWRCGRAAWATRSRAQSALWRTLGQHSSSWRSVEGALLTGSACAAVACPGSKAAGRPLKPAQLQGPRSHQGSNS